VSRSRSSLPGCNICRSAPHTTGCIHFAILQLLPRLFGTAHLDDLRRSDKGLDLLAWHVVGIQIILQEPAPGAISRHCDPHIEKASGDCRWVLGQ